ncbi:MAG TPA: hypothetical protein VE621_02250, partial [Bryobacteraceae bacterium]|nr:hypothetical protein [Bryobacteraceae bacterium]
DTDDWWKLAERDQVKVSGLSALQLCAYNFQTSVPAEINWYLYHKVGCRKTTQDKKNFKFHSDASPGTVYLPIVQMDEVLITAPGPEPVPEPPLKMWFGVGEKHGGILGISGKENINGVLFAAHRFPECMQFMAEGWRVGPGLGGGIGITGVIVTGMDQHSELNGFVKAADWDFNVSVGANVGKAVKLGKLAPAVEFFKKLNVGKVASFVARMNQIGASASDTAELMKQLRGLKEAMNLDPNNPDVFAFDIPFVPGTLEVSFFFVASEYKSLGLINR